MDDRSLTEAPSAPESRPLDRRELELLAWLTRRVPRRWLLSVRSRRLLFLGLAAPGFLAVFTTTLHRNFFVLVLGFLLFGAAVLVRAVTEPIFIRAQAADIWPPGALFLRSREFPHA